MRNFKNTLKINQHKKTAFLHKKAEFSQKYIYFCKKQDFYIKNGFLKAVFYNMVWILLNCSFHTLLKLSDTHVPVSTLQEAIILGLLNSIVNSLKALKVYVFFNVIRSCFLWRSVFQLLDAKMKQAVISFVMFIGRSHTRQ